VPQDLGSSLTNNPKKSTSKPGLLPPSPRPHYGDPPACRSDLRKPVLKDSSSRLSTLPRSSLCVDNSRGLHPRVSERNSTTLALNSTLTNKTKKTNSSSEVFPPSPQSYYGYATSMRNDQVKKKEWSFVKEQGITNYQVPFVNTVSDVEDKRRRNRELSKSKGWDEFAGRRKEEIVIPILGGRADSGSDERSSKRRGRRE
jgi:hypothetical protein